MNGHCETMRSTFHSLHIAQAKLYIQPSWLTTWPKYMTFGLRKIQQTGCPEFIRFSETKYLCSHEKSINCGLGFGNSARVARSNQQKHTYTTSSVGTFLLIAACHLSRVSVAQGTNVALLQWGWNPQALIINCKTMAKFILQLMRTTRRTDGMMRC